MEQVLWRGTQFDLDYGKLVILGLCIHCYSGFVMDEDIETHKTYNKLTSELILSGVGPYSDSWYIRYRV